MANRITLRHGSTAPSASNLLPYELGWNENNLGLYIGQPSGEPLLISSGGGNVTGVKGSAEQNYRHGNVEITAANIGLGNVENTKLSTWTGSTKITTLGTITTGIIPWARLSDVPAGASKEGTVTSITLKAGSGISLDTDNVAITSSGTRTISHADTSSQASVSASGRRYITGITLDTYGHVTGLTTGTETVTDTHYTAYLRAGASGGTTNAATTTGNTYLNLVENSTNRSGVKLAPGSNMAITSDANGNVTFTATNTTYSAGTGLSLSGTTFKVQNVPEAELTWGGKNFSASYGPIDAAMIEPLGANRFAFLKAAGLTIEYSTDGGSNWTDYGATDVQKTGLFGASQSFILGKHSTAGTNTVNDQLRVTIATSAAGIYTTLNKIAIFMNTAGNTVQVKMEKALESTPTTFSTHLDWTGISGWSGWNILNISGITTYGNAAASQYGRIRFTFKQTAVNTNYASASIIRIMGFGGMGWTVPSNMARDGHLYSYDNAQNATFPAQITATAFNGNATSASKLGTSTVGGTDRPIYLNSGVAAQTTYRMAGTNVAATTARAITENLDTGNWYVNGTSDILNQNDGVAYVEKYSDSWIHEIYGDYRTGQIAVRGKNNGTWQAWRKILDSTNYTDYTVTKTGTGASGTWGISISGNAGTATSATTASKLANTAKIGDTNQPVYFTASGEPAAISYTIAKSVPSNAVFTDTWTALSTSAAGYVAKAPNDTTKFLRGDASWATLPVASTDAAGIIKIGTTANDAAAGNHTHALTLVSTTDKEFIAFSHGSKYKLTAGGSNIIFKMPEAGSISFPSKTSFEQTDALLVCSSPGTSLEQYNYVLGTVNNPLYFMPSTTGAENKLLSQKGTWETIGAWAKSTNKPTYTSSEITKAVIGNGRVFYGTCNSTASTAEKAVTCSSFVGDDLVAGTMIMVKFSITNTASVSSLTLNVNSTTAKSIRYIYNGSYSTIPGAGYLKENQIYKFIYDGTYWIVEMSYDTNTNTLLRTYASSTNIEVPLIAQSSANSTTAAWTSYANTSKDWYGVIPNADSLRAKINLSTGHITIPGGITSVTPATGNNSTLVATTAFVNTAINNAIGAAIGGSY